MASARTVVPKAVSRRTVAVRAHCGDKPLIGGPAPDFKCQAVFDQEFMELTLSQYRGKYVVLFFYPLDFTFVCPTEITAFSDRHSEFKAINTEILGVSVDSQFTHLAWIQTDRKVSAAGGTLSGTWWTLSQFPRFCRDSVWPPCPGRTVCCQVIILGA